MLKCEICGNTKSLTTKTKNNKFGMVLCSKHYTQLQRHGRILERTKCDKNQIDINGDIAEIYLYNKNGEVVAKSFVDVDDIERIKNYKWFLHGSYVAASRPLILLHRFLLDVKSNEIIDHIDRNPLNNCKSNLRIVSSAQNIFNSKIRNTNTSGFIGVSYDTRRQKWRARITFNGKDKHLGYCDTIELAIKKRLLAEKEYFGDEYAPQRHLFEKYGII